MGGLEALQPFLEYLLHTLAGVVVRDTLFRELGVRAVLEAVEMAIQALQLLELLVRLIQAVGVAVELMLFMVATLAALVL